MQRLDRRVLRTFWGAFFCLATCVCVESLRPPGSAAATLDARAAPLQSGPAQMAPPLRTAREALPHLQGRAPSSPRPACTTPPVPASGDGEPACREAVFETGERVEPTTSVSSEVQIWPGEPRARAEQGATPSRRDRPARPVEKALYWLKAHQAPDGGWEPAGYKAWCKGEAARPAVTYDHDRGNADRAVGVTGLALSAFLGAGYTNRGRHPFRATVSRGLRQLRDRQTPEGTFAVRDGVCSLRDHGFAALALVEAHAMTRSPIFVRSSVAAVDYITRARRAGWVWSSDVQGSACDTLTTGILVFPLQSARLVDKDRAEKARAARYDLGEATHADVAAFLDSVTDVRTGRVGYLGCDDGGVWPATPGVARTPEASRCTTALGLVLRIFGGADPRKSDVMHVAAAEVVTRLPVWDDEAGSIDAMYWWFGTLAMFQVGGSEWRAWRRALTTAVVESQRDDPWYCEGKGSWDPVGVWGGELGRVGTTALLALSLEVTYRAGRVFGHR